MPKKGVKVNNQVKYIGRKSATWNKLSNSQPLSILSKKKEDKEDLQVDIVYASCFSDGVYRYPQHFDEKTSTYDGITNIVKLGWGRIKHYNGRFIFSKFL